MNDCYTTEEPFKGCANWEKSSESFRCWADFQDGAKVFVFGDKLAIKFLDEALVERILANDVEEAISIVTDGKSFKGLADSIRQIKFEIEDLEAEIEDLEDTLTAKEAQLKYYKNVIMKPTSLGIDIRQLQFKY